jgi:hypothetical protein
MSSNNPDTWARFYAELHTSAERLRQMMKTALDAVSEAVSNAEDESAGAEAKLTEVNRLLDSSPKPVVSKTRFSR